MENPDELSLKDIYRMKQEGALFAELEEGREYVLMLYELYPNGTTSETFVQDPEVAKVIGRAIGIGDPTDGQGWGIWAISSTTTNHEE